MEIYTYTAPLLPHSKTDSILQSGNQDFGSLKRVYRNRRLEIASWIIDSLEVSVRGEDLHSGFQVYIKDNMTWLGRNTWSIFSNGPDGKERNDNLRDRTKMKLSPVLIFTYKDEEYTYSREAMDKTSRVRNAGENLVADIDYESMKTMLTRNIKMYNDALPPMLLACVDRTARLLYR
ncbi:hypothetical protein M3231_10535 [Neobacillus mesonae]|nr:hypothetical protein [Neobacillus mesonae]